MSGFVSDLYREDLSPTISTCAVAGFSCAVFANALACSEAWRDEVIGQLRHCVQTGYIVCDVGLSHIPAERFM
jgi:hypothetical protein